MYPGLGKTVTISTEYLSPEGDTFTLEGSVLSDIAVQTTESLNELVPEVSTVYPYKVVTPIEPDGSTLILSPDVDTVPTASQNYYAPVVFERYQRPVLTAIDRQFKELTVVTSVTPNTSGE
jgi:hypothetical protein